MIDQLEEKSKAVSLTHLAAFAVALPDIRRDMMRMQAITNDLRINASQLNDGLFDKELFSHYIVFKNCL